MRLLRKVSQEGAGKRNLAYLCSYFQWAPVPNPGCRGVRAGMLVSVLYKGLNGLDLLKKLINTNKIKNCLYIFSIL